MFSGQRFAILLMFFYMIFEAGEIKLFVAISVADFFSVCFLLQILNFYQSVKAVLFIKHICEFV